MGLVVWVGCGAICIKADFLCRTYTNLPAEAGNEWHYLKDFKDYIEAVMPAFAGMTD
jgi:hypothetical protein